MVELQPFRDQDIETLLSWVRDEAFMIRWAGPAFTFPLDRVQLQDHLDAVTSASTPSRCFRVVPVCGQEMVGFGELARIDLRHGGASLSRLLVGTRADRGRGLGGHLVAELLRIAFDELGLHRVELGVYDFNVAAIRCYERAGFRHEGVRRDVVRVGDAWWSSCTMAILADEWRAR